MSKRVSSKMLNGETQFNLILLFFIKLFNDDNKNLSLDSFHFHSELEYVMVARVYCCLFYQYFAVTKLIL